MTSVPGPFILPDTVRHIYPNPVVPVCGTPAVVFRDHRWTLPVIAHAAARGMLTLPATVVTLDRHGDALPLADEVCGSLDGATDDFKRLCEAVASELSPRDDNWLTGGMELGLVGDVVQFSSGRFTDAVPDSVRIYRDCRGGTHTVHRLGMPRTALSWKGALADDTHPSHAQGVAATLGFDPVCSAVTPPVGTIVLDIDLDFFTMEWDTVVVPFPPEVFRHELELPCQSRWYDDYSAAAFIRGLAGAAAVVTVATEPSFCGGARHAETIFSELDSRVFDGAFRGRDISVDYLPHYPSV